MTERRGKGKPDARDDGGDGAVSVDRVACLDSEGRAVGPLPDIAHDRASLVALYRGMHLNRAFDGKAIALQRSGRLGTYASSLGQEAVALGIASAMHPDDVLLPAFREHGTQLWRGVSLVELFLYWGGDERGNDFAGPREDFPVCIPVASQFPHAAGVALALSLQDGARAAVAVAGDGATSKGDFYEALNLVGVWRLPAVFVIANNQWAISMRRADQTAAQTLAQKGVAAGVPGVQVDGNDVLAVRQALLAALERARAGHGATLIEALTYRLGDHTTSDDASRYRDDHEVEPHRVEEPLRRLRAFLAAEHRWTDDEEAALAAACAAEVEDAAAAYLTMAPEPPSAMFDHLFATLPDDLVSQRAAVLAAAAGKGGGDG